MRTVIFSEEGFYHIYNRGVERRRIFENSGDYFRFLQILYEFNDCSLMTKPHRRSFVACAKRAAAGILRRPLVSILSFVLMPNHFHLLLQPCSRRGLSAFMHRLGTGYTNYFNIKKERTGRLFESTFKAKHVTSDVYLQHVVRYIHLNPLSVVQPDWKERGIADHRRAERFLREYRWSSYPVYSGEKGVDFLLDLPLIKNVIGDLGKSQRDFTFAWTARDFDAVVPLLSGA